MDRKVGEGWSPAVKTGPGPALLCSTCPGHTPCLPLAILPRFELRKFSFRASLQFTNKNKKHRCQRTYTVRGAREHLDGSPSPTSAMRPGVRS